MKKGIFPLFILKKGHFGKKLGGHMPPMPPGSYAYACICKSQNIALIIIQIPFSNEQSTSTNPTKAIIHNVYNAVYNAHSHFVLKIFQMIETNYLFAILDYVRGETVVRNSFVVVILNLAFVENILNKYLLKYPSIMFDKFFMVVTIDRINRPMNFVVCVTELFACLLFRLSKKFLRNIKERRVKRSMN